MQGLRPLALRRIVLPRSKLRQVDAAKHQPSFLRLASQQEKPRSFLAKKTGKRSDTSERSDMFRLRIIVVLLTLILSRSKVIENANTIIRET